MIPRCFKMHPADNVATMLDDADSGPVAVLGERAAPQLAARERIARGHKIALTDIAAGLAVVKFGARIGLASRKIDAGTWVHLHNLTSALDARSATLDLESGAPTDTSAAYD